MEVHSMKVFQKLFQLLRKKKMSKKEIYQKANSSFEFNYSITKWLEMNKKVEEEESFSEAIQNIPQEDAQIKEVDYYA